MNARKLVLIVLVSALAAAAQTAPPSQRVAPEPASPKKASPFAAAPMRKAATRRPAAVPRATAAVRKPAAGKRDPFVSPVREGGANGPSCSVGKKCLAIDSVVLKGIVTAPAGSIAVVVNSRNATYFLRENDPVFNGYVVKITPDSIVFRENVMDRVGNMTTRDVVKRVSAPAV